MRHLLAINLILLIAGVRTQAAQPQIDKAALEQASRSAEIAGYALSKVQRWLHEKALPVIDPATGLYPADGNWDYRDTGADCYPFLCWAAFVVDKDALDGPVRQNVLHAEQKLCNHVDRIPVRYDWKNKKKIDTVWDEMVFRPRSTSKTASSPLLKSPARTSGLRGCWASKRTCGSMLASIRRSARSPRPTSRSTAIICRA